MQPCTSTDAVPAVGSCGAVPEPAPLPPQTPELQVLVPPVPHGVPSGRWFAGRPSKVQPSRRLHWPRRWHESLQSLSEWRPQKEPKCGDLEQAVDMQALAWQYPAAPAVRQAETGCGGWDERHWGGMFTGARSFRRVTDGGWGAIAKAM